MSSLETARDLAARDKRALVPKSVTPEDVRPARWSAVAAILMGLGVGIGAFGAHGLKGRLDEYSMGVYEKAVLYQFFHALGMLAASILPRVGAISESAGKWVCGLFLAGILLFSGSLYVLALSGVKALGAVTPFGGLAFLGGWFLLAYWLLRGKAA